MKRKMFISQTMAALLLSISLLSGCGSESAPAQGNAATSALADESAPGTEMSSPAESAAETETPSPAESNLKFGPTGEPLVDEADILYSGEWEGINC